MPLPKKDYHSLQSIAYRWGVSFEDIKYYVEHKELSACCWIDKRKLMRYLPSDNKDQILCEYLRFEGYVGVNASDCRKVFRYGKYKVINFVDLKFSDRPLTIAPDSKKVLISINDIVVTTEEMSRFETENHILQVSCKVEAVENIHPHKDIINKHKGLYINSKKYEYFFNGKPFSMGPIQANIVKSLSEVHSSATPWIHSKKLLHDAGSNAVRIRDIFKSSFIWQEIIDSDRRGNYRIKEGMVVNLE